MINSLVAKFYIIFIIASLKIETCIETSTSLIITVRNGLQLDNESRFGSKFGFIVWKLPFVWLGDVCAVNAEPDETKVKAFWNQYQLKSLNKKPTCFKNVNKPSITDSFLTNSSKWFEDCFTLETGLLDFYKLIVSVRFPWTFSSENHKI